MIVRPRSAPSRRANSTISIGARSLRPGWIMRGAPVSRCAITAARPTFSSLSVPGAPPRDHGGRDALLPVGGPRPRAADLADDAGPDSRVAHPDRHIGDDVLGDLRSE